MYVMKISDCNKNLLITKPKVFGLRLPKPCRHHRFSFYVLFLSKLIIIFNFSLTCIFQIFSISSPNYQKASHQMSHTLQQIWCFLCIHQKFRINHFHHTIHCLDTAYHWHFLFQSPDFMYLLTFPYWNLQELVQTTKKSP